MGILKKPIQGAMTDYLKHFKDLKVVVRRIILSSDGKEAAIEWEWNVVRIRDGAQARSPAARLLIIFRPDKLPLEQVTARA